MKVSKLTLVAALAARALSGQKAIQKPALSLIPPGSASSGVEYPIIFDTTETFSPAVAFGKAANKWVANLHDPMTLVVIDRRNDARRVVVKGSMRCENTVGSYAVIDAGGAGRTTEGTVTGCWENPDAVTQISAWVRGQAVKSQISDFDAGLEAALDADRTGLAAALPPKTKKNIEWRRAVGPSRLQEEPRNVYVVIGDDATLSEVAETLTKLLAVP